MSDSAISLVAVPYCTSIHVLGLFPDVFSGIVNKTTPLTQRVALSDFYQLTVSEADSLMEHLSDVCLQVLSDLMYLTEEIAVHDTPVCFCKNFGALCRDIQFPTCPVGIE